MFTGIVQVVGTVKALGSGRLSLTVPDAWPGDPWVTGESLAVDGCCLTVISSANGLHFDLSDETLKRTKFGQMKPGDRVNLERAMKAGDRIGGHIVQGHVDTVGTVTSRGEGGEFGFDVGREWKQYLADKGSVAIDGVSLTVVRPSEGRFAVAVIPHTLEATTLGDRQTGDKVNVEFDVLAKYAVNPR